MLLDCDFVNGGIWGCPPVRVEVSQLASRLRPTNLSVLEFAPFIVVGLTRHHCKGRSRLQLLDKRSLDADKGDLLIVLGTFDWLREA